MNRIAPILLCIVAALPPAACSSTPSARDVERLGVRAVVGSWTSELDDSVLSLDASGRFQLERIAAEARAVTIQTGTWRDSDGVVVMTGDEGSECVGTSGRYAPTVVRDTLRFEVIEDTCPPREERMAWPWKRR